MLERGAGVGWLGLNCLRKYEPSKYIFTDCHQMVLDQCKRNLDHNQINTESNQTKVVIVSNLDWTSPDDCDLWNKDGPFDIDLILASGNVLFFVVD